MTWQLLGDSIFSSNLNSTKAGRQEGAKAGFMAGA
jgi:hypothetical protein